ncbi:MAG: hypothetical protein IPM84_23785 [Anaerolineae bacterium]|nr:hypothetical protein [Anaerolineae bacterium]
MPQNANTFNRQASFVGWGWSLNGLGQVTMSLAQDGTPAKAFLGYAGGGFELKQTTDGWQTEPQSFVRIAHTGNLDSGNKWEVWSPDGVKYTFGGVTGSNATWANGSAWIIKSSCGKSAREMHLTEVLDTHGNHIEITYETEPGSVTGCTDEYVPAIRPTVIRYFAINEPLATVRIELGYSGRGDTGVPGNVGHRDEYTEAFWSNYRLTGITVQVRNGSGADAFTTVGSYVLAQDYDWFDSNNGEGILRLTSITEKGRDGGALPAWTFGYRIGAVGTQNGWKNHTLLETANNGQGGSVTYSYANVPQYLDGRMWRQYQPLPGEPDGCERRDGRCAAHGVRPSEPVGMDVGWIPGVQQFRVRRLQFRAQPGAGRDGDAVPGDGEQLSSAQRQRARSAQGQASLTSARAQVERRGDPGAGGDVVE